jgi:hypothetical protein
VTLVIEVEHGTDYDPTEHFVYYFDDDYGEPGLPQHEVLVEDWEDM